MKVERWQEVKKVLAGALERMPEQRRVYLDQTCTDPDLRREVESLIFAHEQGKSSFMEQSSPNPLRLQNGTTLGSYTIQGQIGSGGMGEVYRAHDTKLKRDVAIKVLPLAFVNDPERLARFQREARLLASLNHPNIATIYGLEDSDNVHALAMELVEGPTLADRIRPGPIPVEEALPIAKQMAEALEYAHEHGIIHRDLKPANVKVTADDTVKILDFGLAKAMESGPSTADMANSPTISQMATEAGVLLGTAAYMSPEQAKGKSVDRRADIWAFGCVLYEMLTGQRAFQGETVPDTLAAIMRAEPDWSRLPTATPMRVRVLLQRCLLKDPKQRLRDIGDARISLHEVLSGAPESAPLLTAPLPSSRRALPWALGLIAVAVTGVAVWVLKPSPAPPPRPVMQLEIPLPENVKETGYQGSALSPDGSKLAFIATGADHLSHLWVRPLGTLAARPLGGTEGANYRPFWSPDSRFIGFFAQGKLKKIAASGGAPLAICDADQVYGGAWNQGGTIVFASDAGVQQVSASGGSPSPIDTAGGASGPSFLPDERHFVYWRWGGRDIGIFLGSVDAKPNEKSVKLSADLSNPVYVPSSDPAVGYLVFVRGSTAAAGSTGTLMAQRFDTRRLRLIGEAVPIAERGVRYSASATDILVYQTSRDIRAQLTWFDREGRIIGTVGGPGVYVSLALSPDGKRVAFARPDPQNAAARNIWLYDFAQGVTTRFTFDDAGWDRNPTWSPDGSRIAYGSFRGGVGLLYEKNSNLAGEEKLLSGEGNLAFEEGEWPTSWSPDGRFLLCYHNYPHNGLALLPLGNEGARRKPVPVAQSKFNQVDGRFSPDGRWIAYESDESGEFEVYVRPFEVSSAVASSSAGGTPATGELMVSKDGGRAPLWRRDGKELFYLGLDGNAMAVEVSMRGGVFRAAPPKALFKVPADVDSWDVSADGKRFLMAVPSGGHSIAQPPFTVVLNWQTALKNNSGE